MEPYKSLRPSEPGVGDPGDAADRGCDGKVQKDALVQDDRENRVDRKLVKNPNNSRSVEIFCCKFGIELDIRVSVL
jgi:hypothetical protein